MLHSGISFCIIIKGSFRFYGHTHPCPQLLQGFTCLFRIDLSNARLFAQTLHMGLQVLECAANTFDLHVKLRARCFRGH